MSINLKIIIVAETASARMGGEAILPLHYFKFLAARGVDVWLVTHERVKRELAGLLDHNHFKRVHFIPDSRFQILCARLGKHLPERLAEATFGWLIHLSTGWRQKKLLRQLVKKYTIDVVHQPMPVSPKIPSFIYNVGAPVIIGPMNGGMEFPAAFTNTISVSERVVVWLGHVGSEVLNYLIPGKRKATLLLVANERTRRSLPKCLNNNKILELVENGVDLTLWKGKAPACQKKS